MSTMRYPVVLVSLLCAAVAHAQVVTTGIAPTETLVSTQTASGSASLAWTGLTGSNYRLMCSILPATNAVAAQVVLGEGSTPTYKTASYYWGSSRVASSAGTVTGGAGNNVASMGGFDAGNQINNAGYNQSFSLLLNDLSSSTLNKGMLGQGVFSSATGVAALITTAGQYQGDTNPITAIKVQYSSGNIASGDCSLYYIK